ncbi:response regulator transcription factor [Anaerosalibacter bizertensis]|uniref:response regulator transcription factor n=1 Tax=Anaerosalibacter bizertensis TaxID=932217 RepID=UPI003511C6F1
MKILIVDDSRFTQKIEGNLLKKNMPNSEIYYASNGEEGLEKYKELEPDFAIIDLLMPGMSGLELIKKIKEYDEKAKLVVVSADVQEKVREEVDSLGTNGFINKPLNEEKVAEILKCVGV